VHALQDETSAHKIYVNGVAAAIGRGSFPTDSNSNLASGLKWRIGHWDGLRSGRLEVVAVCVITVRSLWLHRFVCALLAGTRDDMDFVGKLYNVVIWDKALSAAEVLAAYNAYAETIVN
jgi:hypothetical protein